jgi:hypothetical protein
VVFSAVSVSGRRTSVHTITAMEKKSNAPKIQRHGATSKMSCPMPGATMGTIINTVMAIDITCAMRRPEVMSRTIAVAMTRVAAAPTPCRQRAARKSSNVGAMTLSTAPAMKRPSATSSTLRRP